MSSPRLSARCDRVVDFDAANRREVGIPQRGAPCSRGSCPLLVQLIGASLKFRQPVPCSQISMPVHGWLSSRLRLAHARDR